MILIHYIIRYMAMVNQCKWNDSWHRCVIFDVWHMVRELIWCMARHMMFDLIICMILPKRSRTQDPRHRTYWYYIGYLGMTRRHFSPCYVVACLHWTHWTNHTCPNHDSDFNNYLLEATAFCCSKVVCGKQWGAPSIPLGKMHWWIMTERVGYAPLLSIQGCPSARCHAGKYAGMYDKSLT